MVHPEIGSGWHAVRVRMGDEQSLDDRLEANFEAFIGRFRGDGAYHLLGYRPIELKYLFSENECSSLDLGLVMLPDGKPLMNDLAPGDRITVVNGDKTWSMQYVERF